MLKNEYSLAKIGFDTAENEPSKVWPAEDTGILPEDTGMQGYNQHPPHPPEETALVTVPSPSFPLAFTSLVSAYVGPHLETKN